jgi:hypothetical protein
MRSVAVRRMRAPMGRSAEEEEREYGVDRRRLLLEGRVRTHGGTGPGVDEGDGMSGEEAPMGEMGRERACAVDV